MARRRPADAGSREPDDPAQQAKDVCLRLLTACPRTKEELRQALLRKGIDGEVAESVLGRLDAVGLIDDAAFAETWVRSRHAYQGLGRRALAAGLRRKGVDESVAADAVSTVDRDAEEQRARELVRRKLRTIGNAEHQAKVRRLVGMLARKGYPQGLAFEVVRDELRTAGEDIATLDDIPVDED